MSGNADSGSGGFDWPTTTANSCDIVLQTPLNSTDEEVLRTIRVGDILEVQLTGEADRRLVAVVTPGPRIVGIVTALQAATLLQCIEQGVEYIAEITKLESPSCHVKISCKDL